MTRFSAMPRVGAILTVVLLVCAGIAFGQQVTGTILGRVTDNTRSVVPGATVQIQNPAIGLSRTETADSDGRYLSSNLPLGTYSVTVQKEGFQTLVRSGVVLSVGSEVTVNAELVVGNVQQHVEVTGETPAIETTNATVSDLVDPTQIRDLPLNGRSVDSLSLLAPGVFANRNTAQNATVGLGLHVSIDGARQDWNLYLLDGTVTNDVLSSRSSAAGEALGVEGILEFRLLTHDFSAEYGRVAGGVFSAVTRSGTNEFHGSAYEFLRNTVFDSRNFFTLQGNLPAFQRNQFGAAVGGPILKNKLFFFANYEGLRSRQSIPITTFVPDLNARMGILGGVADPKFNPAIVPYLNLYPLPTPGAADNGGVQTSTNNFDQPIREDYTMVRLDYKITDKDSFFARYVYDPSSVQIPQAEPNFVADIGGDDRFLVLSETHIFSPSALNEFRFAVNRTDPTNEAAALVSVPANLSFVPGNLIGSLTFSAATVGATALSPLGPATSTSQTFEKNLTTESDTVTKIKGAHTIKFGVDVEREQINTSLCVGCNGYYQFSGLKSLVEATPSNYFQQYIGVVPSGLYTGVDSTPARGWRRTLVGAFVQDDYRLRPNLTLNLGLRYEMFSDPVEVSGLSSALINVTGKNVQGPPFTTPKANFAPRVGIAWDPTGSGKTSIRLGAGIFDNELDDRAWFSNATTNASYLITYQIPNPTFLSPFSGPVGSATSVNRQIQYYTEEPTVYEWNLEVQRQLTSTLSLHVGYVGSRGVHLPLEVEENTKVPTLVSPNPALDQNAPGGIAFLSSSPFVNPSYASLLTTQTEAVSSYNGLQVSLLKAVSAGLSFQASYTYSKAMSTGDQIAGGQVNGDPPTVEDPFNLNMDKSLSAFDQRHTLVLNGNYLMPWDHMLTNRLARTALGGWSVNGIYSYGSGLPVDILSGYNSSLSGDTNNPDRPDLIPGFSTNPTSGTTGAANPALGTTAAVPQGFACLNIPANQPLHTAARWFNPCAFQINPLATSTTGYFGTLGRNTVIGPSLSDVDMAIVKTTTLTEKAKLEFRAECFNLANHAIFGLPSNGIASKETTPGVTNYAGNAGQITSTIIDNRELQFGLKLLF